MKKLFITALMLISAAGLLAADLKMRVAAGSPGRVDDQTIDVATVGAGESIVLEVYLEDLDFTLAGAEGNILFPAWLSIVRTDLVTSGATAPFQLDIASLGTSEVQALPANSGGGNTASTFQNNRGLVRVGFIFTNPASRPSGPIAEIVLFTLRLQVGRDIDINLVARALATCISSEEVIEFLACNNGSASCHIIADDSASPVAVNFNQADLQVALIHSGALAIKGDVNGVNGLTTADISPLIQCVFFGQASAGCPLSATPADEYLTRVDVNCDGNDSTADISPAVGRALGTINRLSSKKLDFFALSEAGVLEVKSEEVGSVASLELSVEGQVTFADEIQLDQASIDAGWSISSTFLPQHNVYKYIVMNLSGKDGMIPTLQIPYETAGAARIAVRSSENYLADSRAANYAPTVSDYAVTANDKVPGDKQQTIK